MLKAERIGTIAEMGTAISQINAVRFGCLTQMYALNMTDDGDEYLAKLKEIEEQMKALSDSMIGLLR